jgi:ubiquinone/menaquinone biosynthesis C-methylase UbiE
MREGTEREQFESFYERKWSDHVGYWADRYPPDQIVYATCVYQRRNDVILQEVGPSPGLVVDVGCGVGDIAVQLAGRATQVVATDLSFVNARRTGVNSAVDAPGRVTAVQAAAELLPLADEAVDVVVLADVLEHVPDVVGCLRELRRVLRPGGRLVIATPVRGTIRTLRTLEHAVRTLARAKPLRADPDVYERFLSIGELRSALRAAGFRRASVRRICFYPAPEVPGAFGALATFGCRRIRHARFVAVTRWVVAGFRGVERLRVLNQKQLWVATR